jgi:NAD(P)-dependent dehydrogenase (short-subunit alcohol dehydrogenase family)
MDILGCYSVLYILHALANRFTGSPHLWLVTQGAQSVQPGDPIAVEQSALWGFGKVISFELPELRCVRIDLDPRESCAASVTNLVKQLSLDDREDQIAFREGNVYVLRLLPFSQTAQVGSSEMIFRENNTYLITGGMGGLGLNIARWMAKRGASHIVLLGRSNPSPLALQVVERIRHAGTEVVIMQSDVSNPEQLKDVFGKIKKNLPPMSGVIHAAGLLDDGSLLNINTTRMKNVMAPKVEGTWNLHNLTKDLSLDFFVLFSSSVSVLGSPGQGNYAAANSYMDSMAHFRHHLGLPAVSINWGPWAEVGLAAEAKEKLQEQNASVQHLVKVIEINQGLEMLTGRVMATNLTYRTRRDKRFFFRTRW